MKNTLLVLLGNQLFPPAHLQRIEAESVFMAEDRGLCTYVRHHQQKIVMFLSAMRSHADALTEAGYQVHYQRLDDGRVDQDTAYEERLVAFCQRQRIQRVVHFEIEDRAFEQRFTQALEKAGIERDERESPMFVTPRGELERRLAGKKRPFMADFYKHQRRRLDLLMDGDKPAGGQWSFDADNRKKLPRGHTPPAIDWPEHTDHTKAIIELVRERFADHPGDAGEFCWPTTRRQALAMLRAFLDERLQLFGDYEDAISQRSATIYHSLLSPALNLGLITPGEFLDRLMTAAKEQDTPINNTEGLVRQIIGWREFIRGIDRHFGEHQEESNFFSHDRRLADSWWQGETGIPPLDDAIRGALKRGWNHHIERLMVIGNLMNLCEIEPGEAYRWFMEMYVDSSDWVMGPNVYGMALFSDGGVFATKPYICGANYLLKMSDYGKGEWCDVVDGLYWRFVDKQQDYLKGNPRLNMMLGSLNKMKPERRKTIFSAAEQFLDDHTVRR